MSDSEALNVAVLYGSARAGRRGIKAARFIVKQLEGRGHEVALVDSEAHPLPMLDRMYKEFEPENAPAAMREVSEILQAADCYVIVSGEYNHSIPAALKNLLDHYQSEYHYKPSAIVTYSAGPFGGVRALVNLRGILAELGTPAIPSAFPISRVASAFDDNGNPQGEPYAERAIKFLDEFEWYARALRRARHAEQCGAEDPIQQQMCRG